MEDIENIVMCPNCEEGLKGYISECPANLFSIGRTTSLTPIDDYIYAVEMGFIDVTDDCNCCIECQMDCRCEELVYGDDYDDYDDDYDDEDDEPWDSGH
jgi:hypothetical protein